MFPWGHAWEKVMSIKEKVSSCASRIKSPWSARDGLGLESSLQLVSESPSIMTWLIPNSCANSTAFLAANASTYATVDGKRICCERDAITSPVELRITTLIPALPCSWKIAPWKFTLRKSSAGGFHLVCFLWCCLGLLGWRSWNSAFCSFEIHIIWFSGHADWPTRI